MSSFFMSLKPRYLLGWVAMVLFVDIYGIELLPHHGPPITIRWFIPVVI